MIRKCYKIFNRLITAAVVTTAAVTFSFSYAGEIVVKHKGEPPAQLGIAPPQINQTIQVSQGKQLDQSLTLYNYNNKPKSITLSFSDTNKQRQIIKPGKNTLSPWTIINPKTFTIPPGGQQTIRLSIRPPIKFAKKNHYAMLKIDHHVDNSVKYDESSGEMTVTLGSSYGLPITVNTQ